MKIRKSFVTNSSSSSFVIAVKEENGDLTPELNEKLLEWAKKELLDNGTNKIETIEDLNKYIIETYGYRNDTLEKVLEEEDLQEKYNTLKKAIEDGFAIYTKYISCEGEDEHLYMFDRALDKLKESKDFIGIDTYLSY